MKKELDIELPNEITVRGKKVKHVTVRLPKVADELRAGELARFQTPNGYMQTDTAKQEFYMISIVTNIPATDLEKLNRVEYAKLSEAVGKLEMSVALPPLAQTTKSEENK